MASPALLLTGATGYVGGRLLRALEERRTPVRCLTRRPEALAGRVAGTTEVLAGDVVTGDGLAEALRGIETAVYLVHSMGSPGGFEDEDRRGARNFAAAARAAGVRRIVYLGGLADERRDLSPHLRSRIEVGRVLRDSGVAVIELRASIVIGAGSLSFEMIRAIVDRLPVLVAPRWVSMPAQPIGIDDLLAYLLAALDADPSGSPVYEIGGADRMSYADLMREYARQRGLRRLVLPVPVLTPWLSSLWLALVTPLHARVGRNLIDSIRHPSVVRSDAARRAFSVEPSGIENAIARALEEPAPGPLLVDSRDRHVSAPAARVFQVVCRIGGESGWYAWDRLWRLRGWLDLLFGGIGLRRGRRHPEELEVGDTLDCWRVEALEPGRLLRLCAEMRLPGRAWLEFRVAREGDGSRLHQTASFEPRGLAGRAYWYGIYPLHALVFGGMLRGIAARAEHGAGPRSSSQTTSSTRTEMLPPR